MFSSLILGSYEKGRLIYRGRIGTGFNGDDMSELMDAMKPLARKTPPFDEDLPGEATGAGWVTPRLVVRHTMGHPGKRTSRFGGTVQAGAAELVTK